MATAPQLPPHVQLMGLVAGKWMAQPLYVLAELGVADLLADKPRTAAELAAALDVDADALGRCLRAAAALGVLAEEPECRYSLRPMGEALRSDVPCSVRDFTVLLGSEPTWASFGAIMHTVRTGEPAFPRVHGTDLFAYLADHPDLARAYQGAWGSLTDELAPEAAEAYDFGRYPVIADIGGGHGRMLRHLLGAAPSSRGVLMDRPEVLDAARPALSGTPEYDRITFFPGTLPGTTPPEADAYLLKNTLHCFGDADARAMLLPLAAALRERPDARVLVLDTVVPDDGSFHWSKFIDIEVMVNNGGRERRLDEWTRLLESAGLRLVSVTPVTPPQSLLEVAAVR
ncbi:methyltransferase [Streptomyces puniciscabiei]|uniref:methyltransferase n=1 Tax=Streptomyces puniciscabiei TaxID=164348 RepID=UPI0037A3AB8A